MEFNDDSELKASIFYCFREKYHNSMLNLCKEGMSKFKFDVSFKLYHALSLLLNNRLEESINELDSIKLENDLKLAVTIALMYTHKFLGVSNKELFTKLDSQMKEYRKSASATDFYHSGFALLALNKPEKALDYLDKSINIKATTEALVLKGWVALSLARKGQKIHDITEMFEKCLNEKPRNLDATLGLAESFLFQSRPDDALNTANKAIVKFPSSNLPLIVKMRIQFALFDWEQVAETMNRTITNNSDDLDALKMNIVLLLCREAKYGEAAVSIRKYLDKLEQKEPKNGKILLENAQLFSRICGKSAKVLKETCAMLEKALQTDAENSSLVIELGYQCLLLNKTKEANKYFKASSKVNNSSLRVLMGLTLCELAERGKTEQVSKQVDFVLELEDAHNCPKLYFIRARLAENAKEALEYLKKVCDIQLSLIKNQPYSDSYLMTLDPDFMLDVAKEYFKYISSSTLSQTAKTFSSVVKSVQNILSVVTKSCPGLYEGLFLLSKLQYLNGETMNAMNSLEQILAKVDDTFTDAHLLMAQIQIESGFYERASQSLEMCLSNDFKVRGNPMYHYIRGLVDKNMDNYQDALKSFSTALNLIQTNDYKASNVDLSLNERSLIYIESINIHNIIGQTDEALKLLEDAVEEFQGTPEESRILILCANHDADRHNIQGAIDMLNKVKPGETYYFQAKTRLAEILLKYRMDKFAYMQCYQEMVNENPGADSYLLLGDAYMNILEPDDALEAYNKALQQNPKDSYLTSKMGKALVETHYFAKAITFYKEAIKQTDDSNLKLHLAHLYMQLKEYGKAEFLLKTEIDLQNGKNVDDLTFLQYKTKLLNLLAQVQEKSGKVDVAFATLKEAKDNQNRVRKRIAVEQTTIPDHEIKLLVDTAVKLAEISVSLKNNQATKFYTEALEVSPEDVNVMAALAKLYMQMNYLDPCQQVCTNILKIDPDNETASVMMADIAFRKIDFDMAMFHFTQLIIKQPTNWTALVRLVEVMRRSGNLEDVPEYLKNAEQGCANPLKEPGLLFCTALYQWYSGNLNGALRNFNGARQDTEWGLQALYNMIEICLNPDDEMLGNQFSDNEDADYRDSRSMALKTADRLLKELKTRLEATGGDFLKHRLLANFCLLAKQEKFSIEQALDDFVQIASQNAHKEHIGPILGMATAYTLLKQTQRAKNQLKRVAKTAWTFEDAEYLEKCWLLLANYYIQSAKFDVAVDLLNKIVQYNKACSKAYEYLGFVAEKEQRYVDAVEKYDQAWRFGGKSNTGIGFKLAYNLMKCKKYADAIDVAYQVLKLNPDYPRIRKDVLDKSLNNLRM